MGSGHFECFQVSATNKKIHHELSDGATDDILDVTV